LLSASEPRKHSGLTQTPYNSAIEPCEPRKHSGLTQAPYNSATNANRFVQEETVTNVPGFLDTESGSAPR